MHGNQVPTMARENSGTAPKMRTYGQLRGYTLQKATRPNYLTGQGGATLDLASPTMALASHKTGYYVGGYSKPLVFPLQSDVRPFQQAIREVFNTTGGRGLVGTWVHNGLVYAQWTEHHESRFQALMVARALGQVEIFDIAAGKSIPVTPPAIRLPRK